MATDGWTKSSDEYGAFYKDAPPMPEIKSKHSLVHKHLTPKIWEKYAKVTTKTTGFTIEKACACAIKFDDQHCGLYIGDEDCLTDFAELTDPIIQEYHGIDDKARHKTDMDLTKIKGAITDPDGCVKSTRIRVGRNIRGFGLSPGITKTQRLEVEKIMVEAFSKLKGDLAGKYYPMVGMDDKVRQKLVDDHFLFKSGDRNLIVGGMERDWPEGRGIFLNDAKTFLVWVNEEDQLRIISMQMGGDVKEVFSRLVRGIEAIESSVKTTCGRGFQISDKYGFLHSCPTNLGTGMRASVHVALPAWKKAGKDKLKARCEELRLQPRGTRGETGGDTGDMFDISNKHRLGWTEVELVQTMIDGVNALVKDMADM